MNNDIFHAAMRKPVRVFYKCGSCSNARRHGSEYCGPCEERRSKSDELNDLMTAVKVAGDGNDWRAAVESLLEELCRRADQ